MSVQVLIEKQLGAPSINYTNRETSSVATTSTRILRQDPNRLFALIINLSVNDVYATPARTPSTSNGVLIGPNGGTLSLEWDEDYSLTGQEWNAIAPAGASNVHILEAVLAAEKQPRATPQAPI